jgi:hypothetical protein
MKKVETQMCMESMNTTESKKEYAYPLIVCPMDYDDVYLCYFLDIACLTPGTVNKIPKEYRLPNPAGNSEDDSAFTEDAAWEVPSVEEGKDIGEKLLAAFLKECKEEKRSYPEPSKEATIGEELSRQSGAEVHFVTITLQQ